MGLTQIARLLRMFNSINNKKRLHMMHSFKRREPDVDMENITQRRTFLKKAVYAAPTLMVLGGMVKPTQTRAGFGNPPSDPDAITSNQVGTVEDDSGTNDFNTDIDNGGNDNVVIDNGGKNDIVANTLDSGL
jgi:hypothetical protein